MIKDAFNGNNIYLCHTGTKHFLLMCNVKGEDSGEIKFVAKNVESIAYLEVESKYILFCIKVFNKFRS